MLALKKMELGCYPPVIVCIGSDLSIGDSLGPICGSKLKERLLGSNVYIYGTLQKPITAKEVNYVSQFLKQTHPNSPILAIDAAVGREDEIGLIKISSMPIKPGSGANKNLNEIGDMSIMGIIAEKSLFSYTLLSNTRLNIVYKMSEIIVEGVIKYIDDLIFRMNTKKSV